MSIPVLEPSQPSIEWVPKFYAGAKRPGFVTDHASPPIAAVKNECIRNSVPPTCLHDTDRNKFLRTILLTCKCNCYSRIGICLMVSCEGIFWCMTPCTFLDRCFLGGAMQCHTRLHSGTLIYVVCYVRTLRNMTPVIW